MHSTPCAYNVTALSGIISSSSAESYKDCKWSITAPRGYNIRLKFNTFQLSNIPTWQMQSQIHIYDALSANESFLIGVFNGTRKPFEVQSSGRYMLLELTGSAKAVHNFKGAYNFSTKKGEFFCLFILNSKIMSWRYLSSFEFLVL